MIKFCWTKACPLCGAALKLKHSLYTLRCNSFLSLFCPPTPHPLKRHLYINTHFQQQSNDYTQSLTVFYSRREAIMARRDSDDDSDTEWAPPKQLEWYKSKANITSSNSMLQTNVREEYGITTLEVVELIEDLISYSQLQLLKSLRSLTLKDWLAVAKCTQLRNAQIPKYGAKVKTEDLSNTLTLILSETAQRRSSSVVFNRSTALITDKFGVASLTEPAILNDANVTLVDAVHYSVVKQFPMFRLMTKESQQKLEKNYFEVMDALTITLIEDDDDLLGTVNSHIKLRRLGARRKTEAADSRHAKASGGRTKKDKDLEDSDTGSDVSRLRRRDRAAARARSAERKRDDYCLDSSSDIDPEDDSEDEEATTAKDLLTTVHPANKQTRTRDGLSARVGTAMEYCTLEEWTSAAVFFGLTDAYILYFKELLSDNSGIFANAMGMGKTRAIVLAIEVQNARAEGDAIEYNAVDDDDKLCPTEGERTFYCACERSLSFNAEPRQAATMMTGWGRAANAWKNEVVAMDLANSTWCDLSDPLALRFCFFSNSPPENMGRLTKEEAMEMRIDTTDAISKALAAANKLVALRSYTIPEANTPAVHSEATKHRLALLAARFVIVCGFRKVDKHVFRAYNTMSVTAQRTIIRKGGPYVEKRAILLPGYVTDIRSYNYGYQWKAWALSGTPIEQGLNEILIFVSLALIGLQNRKGVSNWFNATNKRDSVTSDPLNGLAMAKQWRNMIANVKYDASEHESSYEFMLKRTLKTRDLWGKLISGIKGDFLDILEKEGLDESEASRRVIFNCFEMQAIASYSALATLKAAQFKTYSSCKVKRFTLNSVKDLFTNLSKDYFLVREARAITKSSPKFQNLSNLCSEVEILGTLSRTWSIAAEDAAKAANILLLLKEVCAKILIESYKPIVQAVTWLGLREKFSDESVLVMQRGMTQHEINLKLAKWRDLDRPWIIVASMAFAEVIILTEATHVLAEMCVGIVYFNPDSELELKVLGKQDVKITSRDKLQGRGLTVTD
ncbi:hypothetical protein HBI55_249360 [Parastagonospora nodorum]|nr:hypothetical protein HBI55_249360 [Parastagonospora nodorum]